MQRLPITLGPAITTATTTGVDASTFHDAQYSVDLVEAQAGGAGCVRATAPGGTHAVSQHWSVLGAVSGDSLRADLVPAAGDGSGWHLRTTINALRVGTRSVDVVAGTTMPVSTWGTLTIGAQANLPRLQPLQLLGGSARAEAHACARRPAGRHARADRIRRGEPRAGEAAAAAARDHHSAYDDDRGDDDGTPTGDHDRADHHNREAEAAAHEEACAEEEAEARGRSAAHWDAAARWPVRLPGRKAAPTGAIRTAASGRMFPAAGTTATTSSRRSAHRSSRLQTGRSSRSVGTASAGWRLWLVDHAGNDFYYAHLSGYTTLARNNRSVHRGDVIGFVGNTGDAFTTQPHLHFEVHPTGLLYLGYDGAVDPTTYLRSWSLPQRVKVLPPIELPDGAPSGFGSAADFRRLLAVHPRPPKPSPPAKTEPENAGSPTRRQATRIASGPVATGGTGAGSTLPIVAGILLLAGGLAAVVHAARDGRT